MYIILVGESSLTQLKKAAWDRLSSDLEKSLKELSQVSSQGHLSKEKCSRETVEQQSLTIVLLHCAVAYQ